MEKKEFVEDLRRQWRTMWRERIDDRTRAEGIAEKDYSPLFVERGAIIIATRKFRPPDFLEILQQHGLLSFDGSVPPSPFVGGWRKFIRTYLRRPTKKRSLMYHPPKPKRTRGQQLKKGGRGWLHREV